MLQDCAQKIKKLERQIERAHEDAELNGEVDLPPCIYKAQDEIEALRRQMERAPLTSRQEAIAALKLASARCEPSEARLIRRVASYFETHEKI